MFLRGTLARDSAAFSAALDALGARVKVVDDPAIPYDDYYTTPEYSYVRLEVPAARWREAISLLGEIVRFPRLAADEPAPDVFSVADHVNLRLRGALTGRWPVSAPRVFPEMNAVYEREPAPRRPSLGPRVYSGLTVAGVGDARALTPFERRAIGQLSLPAASDCLVDAVIVAAYHGLSVAAWCVPLPV